MTIHSSHPFADPEPDPVRRLRGRLGGAVTLLTSGTEEGVGGRAGLTVTSVMIAGGEPGRVLCLLDPDSDLRAVIEQTGTAVLHLLQWQHRDLAEAFAGTAPAPGGPFKMAEWEQITWGPRLVSASTWAGLELESVRELGWSDLAVCRVAETHLGADRSPLAHRRGRYAVAPYGDEGAEAGSPDGPEH